MVFQQIIQSFKTGKLVFILDLTIGFKPTAKLSESHY